MAQIANPEVFTSLGYRKSKTYLALSRMVKSINNVSLTLRNTGGTILIVYAVWLHAL